MYGLDVVDGKLAREVIDRSFQTGLMLEASGATDQVLKFMPALTIEMDLLEKGLDLFEAAFDWALQDAQSSLPGLLAFPSVTPIIGTTVTLS
jgi:diaminobutyrate-2-oxoglutarate transaminase